MAGGERLAAQDVFLGTSDKPRQLRGAAQVCRKAVKRGAGGAQREGRG